LRTRVTAVSSFVIPLVFFWFPLGMPLAVAQGAARHVPVQLDANVYRLAAGDVVQVAVYGEPDLTLKAAVEPSGKVNYPFLGEVRAAGLTTPQLQAELAAGLRNGFLVNPDVRVSVAEYRPIYITGQVRSPGTYPYSLGLTVEQALTLAHGPTDYASMSHIYVQHENEPKSSRTRDSLDTPILPGDTIFVDERSF
jgi:polysaccharide export outer membrane protein